MALARRGPGCDSSVLLRPFCLSRPEPRLHLRNPHPKPPEPRGCESTWCFASIQGSPSQLGPKLLGRQSFRARVGSLRLSQPGSLVSHWEGAWFLYSLSMALWIGLGHGVCACSPGLSRSLSLSHSLSLSSALPFACKLFTAWWLSVPRPWRVSSLPFSPSSRGRRGRNTSAIRFQQNPGQPCPTASRSNSCIAVQSQP